MIFVVILLLFGVENCSSVIYQLNGTQYSRMPALFALDDYHSCVNAGNVYCLVQLDLHADSPNEVMDLIKGYSSDTTKHYNYTHIERGVCVSKLCDRAINNRNINKDEVENEFLEECMNRTIWNEYKIKTKISQVYYCERESERLHIDEIDWIFIVLITIIVLLNVLGTSYDVYLSRNKKTEKHNQEPEKDLKENKYILSFSILQNAKYLFSTQNAERQIAQLKGFDGAKWLLQMGVVFNHANHSFFGGFIENPRAFEKFYDNSLYYIVANGLMVVQAFFVMSGFLLTYFLLLNLKTRHLTWKDVFKIIFLRWWRLTPAYAVLVVFSATLLRHLGSGPLWKFFVINGISAECRKYWWYHILYLNNFVQDEKLCLYQTWYSATEIQLFIIGLILYKMTSSRNFINASLLMIVVGVLATAAHIWIKDLNAVVLYTPEFLRVPSDSTFSTIHRLPYSNLPSFVIGMLCAYVIYFHWKNCHRFSQNTLLKKLSWSWLPSMFLLFISGQMFYTDAEHASLALRVLYGSTCRVAMGCISAFVIGVIVFRINELVCTIFEWNGWVVLSRLSYCVFLVHTTFTTGGLGARTQLLHVSFLNLIILYIGILIYSIIAASLLYLLVEAPVYRFVRLLAGVEQHKGKKMLKSI